MSETPGRDTRYVKAMLAAGLAVALATGAVPGGQSPASATVPSIVHPEVRAESLVVTIPILKGVPKVGKTLRVQVSRTGTVKPALRFDWLRDGVRIGGASGDRYELKGKDRGHRISVQVTATSPGYDTLVQKSASVKVGLGTLKMTKPKLKGSTRAGGVLKARVSRTGAVKPSLRYTWFRSGSKIGGAHKSSYKLKKKDVGHTISVRVTGTKTGYRNIVKTSKKSAVIRPKAIDDPTSIQVVVNKKRPLQPANYVPGDLRLPSGIENTNGQPVRAGTAAALERMVAGARANGLDFRILSGYRSYDYQRGLYNGYVARDGQAAADLYSARPGHSEHQTGLTVDLGDWGGCGLGACFAGTATGRWLAANSSNYGFILRYPDGYTHITGYAYEPWHFRYVGPTVATDMKRKGIKTLEEYRGLAAAPDYN